MNYKKYLILAGIILIFVFPEQIFPAFAGVMIILLLLLLVIELILDVYIVVAILIQKKREDKGKPL